jgi:26S proteasome regulatory subunit N3
MLIWLHLRDFQTLTMMQAMRFPMNQHRLELKNAQEARERERELAKEIVDGEMDEDDAGGDLEGM